MFVECMCEKVFMQNLVNKSSEMLRTGYGYACWHTSTGEDEFPLVRMSTMLYKPGIKRVTFAPVGKMPRQVPPWYTKCQGTRVYGYFLMHTYGSILELGRCVRLYT
jgi:hypothetical protein